MAIRMSFIQQSNICNIHFYTSAKFEMNNYRDIILIPKNNIGTKFSFSISNMFAWINIIVSFIVSYWLTYDVYDLRVEYAFRCTVKAYPNVKQKKSYCWLNICQYVNIYILISAFPYNFDKNVDYNACSISLYSLMLECNICEV